MSDIMEKTLASLPGFLTGNYGTRGANISAGFQNLIQSIGEAKSKHEEERIIRKELELLKQRLVHPDINRKQMREYLVRLIYCEMLGQDASFGYIHALKFAQQGTLLDKRVGYLAVSLFLHENHDLVVLLVNTIQRDIRSTNIVEVCMAILAVCKLTSTDMIPAMLPLIEEKLGYPKAIVRMKAVMALHQFHQKAPNLLQHIRSKFRTMLCDKDPGVMSATLYIYDDLIKKDASKYKDLVPSLVNVLQQIIDRKLPSDYEYHDIPAPWLQIRLLKVLARLGADDEISSNMMNVTLGYTLQRCDQHHSMAYAILYQCILTICQIKPHPSLVNKAAVSVGKFLKSKSNNLRYLGLNALSALIKVNPSCAIEHQLIVIECLNDPDDAIKRKTLDLLHRMCNQSNVEIICEKLVEYLRSTKDNYIQKDLVSKITELAEKFSPSAQWYLNTINQVFLIAGNIVPREVANNLMRLIAEDTSAEEYDRELRINAVQSYSALLTRPVLPDALIQVICWVIGEFSYLDDSIPPNEVLTKMSELLQRNFDDVNTNSWVLSAMMKVVAYSGVYNDTVTAVIKRFQHSGHNMDIRQRACEFNQMCQDLTSMKTILPAPTSHTLEIDSTLSFLDEYVSEGLSQGVPVYKTKQQRQSQQLPMVLKSSLWAGLNFEPYKSPTASVASTASKSTPPYKSPMITVALDPSLSSGTSGNSSEPMASETLGSAGLNLTGVRKVWSKEGFKQTKVVKERPEDDISTMPVEKSIDGLDIVENRPTKSSPVTQISSATAIGEASQPIEPVIQSEEDIMKHQLANALFSGIVATQDLNNDGVRKPHNSSQKTVFTDSLVEGIGHLEITERETTLTSNVDLLSDINLLDDIDNSLPEQTVQSSVSSSMVHTKNNVIEHEVESQNSQQSTPMVGVDFNLPANTSDIILDTTSLSANVQTVKNVSKIVDQRENIVQRDDIVEVNVATFTGSTGKSELVDIHKHHRQDEDKQTDDTNANDLLLSNSETVSFRSSLLDTDNEDNGMMLESIPVLTRLPDELKEYPCATEHVELVSDLVLRVTACKVWKPDVVAMVIFLTNQSKDIAKEFKMSLDIPSNLKVTIDGTECNTYSRDVIESCNWCTTVVNIQCKSPAMNMVIGGQMLYKDKTNTSKRLFFNCSLYMSDFLRPVKITTEEFGQKWKVQSRDKKVKIENVKVKTMSEYMQIVEDKLHLYPVEIIVNEGISYGCLLDSSSHCLLHGKITSSGTSLSLDLWIKTSSQLFSDAVTKQCVSVFQS